jgi:hypothetical protein
MHRLLLTFDVEDFINPNAIYALQRILEIIQKYNLKAIFFITGHMAEKLSNFPQIINVLKNHEIGFHSSSHSVRPTIPEYTDVKNYEEACAISLERETSRINPLTGKPERNGGIYFLQDLFHPKKIEAFRAPGMCWTPPHLEALKDLGIKYDFSSSITTSEPVHYQGITFYPYTFIQQWDGSLYDYQCLMSAILKRKIAVFDLHPTLYVNRDMWDSIYYKCNPPSLLKARKRRPEEVASLFTKFELLLNQIRFLQQIKLIEVNPNLNASSKKLATNKNEVERCYERAIRWPKKFFNYNPRFILNHFYEFFENAYQ